MPALLLATRPAALSWRRRSCCCGWPRRRIAWWISRPRCAARRPLTAEQTRFLRALARRTWAFFETFVGPEDHWLPPDNVQDNRAEPVAHRTSPTNIGLALLANLAAYDFGYLTGRRN